MLERTVSPPRDYPELEGYDFVELFVGNVHQAAHFYRTVWGFEPFAWRDIELGRRDRISIVLRQGLVKLVVTGGINAVSEVSRHVQSHGEGIGTVAFRVGDAVRAFQIAVSRGAIPITEPHVETDDYGKVTLAEVGAFNGLSHVFVGRRSYQGDFLPGFRNLKHAGADPPFLTEIDHVAVAVDAGTLDSHVNLYREAFGFEMTHREDVSTEYSGMNSRVLKHAPSGCTMPLVEPQTGRRVSQVQDFLRAHNGPGVQHLALRVASILEAVRTLRDRGVEFLKIPASYYENLKSRVGSVDAEFDEFRNLGILVDRDEWGLLLQVFTRSWHDRKTLFFELVERRGARGFGGANIRALFESLEREQVARVG